MRVSFFAVLLSPLLRVSVSHTAQQGLASARRVPLLQYPICRRSEACAVSYSSKPSVMSGLSSSAEKGAERLANSADPANAETQILESNEVREEALTEVDEKRMEEVELPKLSAAEYRVYNSMADHMEYFHNHFRQSWTMLYKACETGKRPASLSMSQFLTTGLQFIHHLEVHHSIEEMHIFPVLARKMPEFENGKNAAELLRQHQEIHKGMEVFEKYLKQVKTGETELDLRVLKTKMDNWGGVLWKHLDQEVKTLGADNMRKAGWTLAEMKKMPM